MTKIFVSGHRGMVGSALIRRLQKDNKGWELIVKTRDELDLCDQIQVEDFFLLLIALLEVQTLF